MKDLLGKTTREKVITSTVIIIILLMVVLQWVQPSYFTDDLETSLMNRILLQLLGSILFAIILIEFGFHLFNPIKSPFTKTLLYSVPPLLVAIYNFPFIAYFMGNAVVSRSGFTIFLFAVNTITIATFEEFLFRGVILLLIVKRLPHTTKGIFQAIVLSSIIFSMTHIINLFTGVSFFDTAIQIGYAFLIGLLWSVVLLKTKNIWIVVILHAIYNFGGQLFFTLGTIHDNLDFWTIATTTLLAVVVGTYAVWLLRQISEEDIKALYN